MLARFFSLILFFSVSANSSQQEFIPDDKNVLTEISPSSPPSSTLGTSIRLLSWNILKGEIAGWEQELDSLQANRNVILLQEGMLNPSFRKLLSGIVDKTFVFAASFLWEQAHYTGIYNGGSGQILRSQFFRSLDREPFSETPKMALSTDFSLDGVRTLRVINVHSLNFVDDMAYERQLAQALVDFSDHTGPMLLAGDFNTSNQVRWEILERLTTALQLRRVPTNSLPPWQSLDHIFVKDCEVTRASELPSNFSDHPALMADLDCSKILESSAVAF